MEKIFDQEYLDKIRATGADVHNCLKIIKEFAHKCSQLERKFDELKENRNPKLN